MRSDDNFYPLSQTELGIFLACTKPTTAYNLPFLLELPEEIGTERFLEAVRAFFDRHPGLFSRIVTGEDGSIGRKIVKTELFIPSLKLSSLEELPETRPYDLMSDPLYRLCLVETPGKRYFYFEFHHLIADGSSVRMLVEQIPALYEGQEPAPERAGVGELARKEEELRESEAYQKAKAVYTRRFAGIENNPVLPFDKKEETLAHNMIKLPFAADAAGIAAFVKKTGVRTSTFFLGAFSWLLAKLNMEKEALLATVHNGRTPENADTFGMFVKTLPLYASFKEEETVSEYLREIDAQLSELRANDLYSFTDASRELGVSADILFAYQGDSMLKTVRNGKEIRLTELPIPEGKGIMSVELHRDNGAYEIWFEYRSDLYREETIRHIIRLYEIAVAAFMQKETIGQIDLTDEAELAHLNVMNETDVSFIRFERTILDDFYDNTDRFPDKDLVVFKDRHCSYREADEITNRIAARLKAWGLGKNRVVSVLIPKCEYTMLASLGVLKSGAGYQPLDPTYPRERLNFMIEDADAGALILDRALDGLIEDFDGPRLYLDEIPQLPAAGRPVEHPSPEDLFIMLYTSGTTGKPKGVMLEHGNIHSFCECCHKLYDEDENIKTAAYASYGFDADMMDLYPAMTAGGTVYIIPEEMRLDLMALEEFFNEAGITHSFITTQVGRQFAEMAHLTTMKHFFVGGERLVPMDPPAGYTFHNIYGPTEGTVYCCDQPVLKRYYSIPIGKHLPDYKFYVVDEAGRRLPWGVKGELCIAGPQVARGYLNRPVENAKAFLKNPFDTDPVFERLYKTGDVVRFLEDGAVDFIGRSDGQVKIRGFRVELAEVEQIVREFPGIKDATVKDFTDPAGVKFIAAYVVSDAPVDIEALCAFIGRNKPPYMIPACVMQLDAIPLNQNQKVNKRALPAPTPRQVEIVPPASVSESRITDILAAVLGHASFGVTTDIYEAGLTSVSAIRLSVQLSKAFGKPFKNSDLASHPTVRQLAVLAEEGGAQKEFARRESYPLTKTQEGIFVECFARPEATLYNIPYLFTLPADTDTDRLAQAVERMLAAHPYVMSHLDMNDDGDVVIRREERTPKVSLIEGELPDDAALVRAFTLLGGDLYRAEIYKGKEQVHLFMDFHHILCDGSSEVILLQDLSDAFEGKALETEDFSGYELALEEEEERKGERLEADRAYFETLLAGADPDLRMKKSLKTGEAKLRTADLTVSLSKKELEGFAERSGLTLNAVFNFVFGFTLSKYLYKDEALYATIYNGRSDSRTVNLVSMLVKTLPVFMKYQDGEDLIEAMRKVKAQLEASQTHDLYSFAEIASAFGVNAETMFIYHGSAFRFDHIGRVPAGTRVLDSDTPKSAFSLDVFPQEDGFRFRYEYDGSQYNEAAVASFHRTFVHILTQVEAVRRIGDLDLVSEEDKALYETFNDTVVPLPKTSFNRLFEAQAKRLPDKTALIAPDGSYTYRELNETANRIARGLRERGLAEGEKVVMMVPRVRDAYALRQGIIKSGAAFVPVDPKYPDDRIAYIIEASGAGAVVTTASLLEEKKDLIRKAGVPVYSVDALKQTGNAADPEWEIDPESLAYVIFTSGSTGKPKGVMIAHRNLVNYCLDGKNLATYEYRLIGEDVVSCAFASLSFDASLQEECIPLSHGYTVVMAGEAEIENPMLLADMFEKNGVNLTFLTPSYVANVADVEPVLKVLRKLKVLDMGAEAVPVELIEKLRKEGVSAQFFNGYGPTETTVTCTYAHVTDEYLTIGKPVGNTKLYLLDPHGHILPIGAIGDLTMAGDCVGMGYLGLQDKTAERFISVNGLRAFRSGDMARYNEDGNIEFFGRLDNQVKLRGLRIELDEIEKAIAAYDTISTAIVVVKNNAAEGDYLAAYFTASKPVNKEKLTEFIGRSLTPYMIPKVMIQLDKFPLTPSGKVDKRALPEPVLTEEKREIRQPRNETEKKIAALFARALGVKEVGVDEDFFDRGGTSLSVSKVAMLAVGAGLPIAYGDVFDNPTVEALARHVAAVSGQKETKVQADEGPKGEEALAFNTLAHLDGIRAERELGRVLLTGATGFLGIHVLRELLRQEVPVLALVRGSRDLDAETRLKAMLMYYFDSPLDEEVDRLVQVIDGDVTDSALSQKLAAERFDTIVNCAACVKHFAADDIIERVNVGGVKNLITLAREKKTRLIQISTLSVAGENIDGKFPESFRLREDQLAVGQDISNKYVNSKYKAEQALMEAKAEGLDFKIIRVGNLMGRQSDGEFQINSVTNGFIRDLKGYQALGAFPVSGCDTRVDFSPIDEVAKVILLLAKTPAEYTLFHAANSHEVEMGDIIEAMNRTGFDIRIVPDDLFQEKLAAMMEDENANMLVAGLISYASSDQKLHEYILTDNRFSIRALYRLGYKWPITDEAYLVNVIEALQSLDFFARGDI